MLKKLVALSQNDIFSHTKLLLFIVIGFIIFFNRVFHNKKFMKTILIGNNLV